MISKLNHKCALTACFVGFLTLPAFGQAAPTLRAEISANETPAAIKYAYDELSLGVKSITIPGAEWLQLDFDEKEIGQFDRLHIISPSDESSQSFDRYELLQTGGVSAIFNGDTLLIHIEGQAGLPPNIRIHKIIIGVAEEVIAPGVELATSANAIRNTLGEELEKYLVVDDRLEPISFDATTSVCGPDGRTPNNDVRVGRLMPIGCTGWIVSDDQILTAGHCISSATQVLQFNVPPSRPNGSPVAPKPKDQYIVDQSSILKGEPVEPGNDWATLRVFPNSQTGLLPRAAQGSSFKLSNTATPSTVRITGYGVDGPKPYHGNPPPRDASNQINQTHSGDVVGRTLNGPSDARITYKADTQGGNSGSPVIDVSNPQIAVGIHTNGGCRPNGGANLGTSFRNSKLWEAVRPRR